MQLAHTHRIGREELEDALRKIAADRFGRRARVTAWRRRVSAYSSSSVVARIRLEHERPTGVLQLAFKDLTPGRQLPTARRVRPPFLYDPVREIATYEQMLGRLNLGTARMFGAVVAPEMPRSWLFLEWINGPLLWQMGRMTHWLQAARWLAGFHHHASRLPEMRRLLAAIRPLHCDAQFYAGWAERAEATLRNTLLRSDRRSATLFARMIRRYDRLVSHLAQLPSTLVHGEFYPANIVMRWNGVTHQVCPIDWELTGWAAAVLDLAALAAGQWTASDRRRILSAYHGASLEYSPSPFTLDELAQNVAYAQLHLCIRQLGWAPRWRPEGQQARAWLSDALTLAAQLGL